MVNFELELGIHTSAGSLVICESSGQSGDLCEPGFPLGENGDGEAHCLNPTVTADFSAS